MADGPVFVAGATGHTGQVVVRHSLARGHDTVAHVRPDSSRLDHWRAHFEALGARVDTTAWTLDAFTRTLTQLQPRVVHSLLGTTRKRGKRGSGSAVPDSYEAVDYGLSVLLLEAALACGSRPRFVYLSALGADGRSGSAYLAVRKRVEAAVRGSGLPYLIARPAFIGGERDEHRAAEGLALRAIDGTLGLLAALGARRTRDRYASLTGEQLGTALVELADEDEHAIVAEVAHLRRAAV